MKSLFVSPNFINRAIGMVQNHSLETDTLFTDNESQLVEISEILKTIVGSIWWKNLEGVYMGCNERTLQIVGSDVQIGRIDSELHWEMQAISIMNNDQKVIQHAKTLLFDEKMLLPNGKIYHCKSVKTPIYNSKGHIVGTIGNSMDISELEKLNNIFQNQMKQEVSLSDHLQLNNLHNIFSYKNRYYSFKIKNNTSIILIPRRQMECLFCLFQGYKIKEIAKILKLSHRTVEYYLEITKSKLGFCNRAELIEIFLENISIQNLR